MSILGVKSNFRIVADIEFANEDGTVSTISVETGSIVDISYVKNSSIIYVKGKIERISPETNKLVIDNSAVYARSLDEIYIGNVRSLSIVEPVVPVIPVEPAVPVIPVEPVVDPVEPIV